jgi:hypothetical protein
MKRKASQSRSISIRISMRAFNDVDKILERQENEGTKKERAHAAMVRRRFRDALPQNRQ